MALAVGALLVGTVDVALLTGLGGGDGLPAAAGTEALRRSHGGRVGGGEASWPSVGHSEPLRGSQGFVCSAAGEALAIATPLEEPRGRIGRGEGELLDVVDLVQGQLASGPAMAGEAESDEVPAHQVGDVAVDVMDGEDLVPAAARGQGTVAVLAAPAGGALDEPGDPRPLGRVAAFQGSRQTGQGGTRIPEQPWTGSGPRTCSRRNRHSSGRRQAVRRKGGTLNAFDESE